MSEHAQADGGAEGGALAGENPPGVHAGDGTSPRAEAAGGVVESDRTCTRCSYNLRGLAINGNCPECGAPVADSLRGLLLQYASPEYLQAVGRGLSLILNGLLVWIIAMIGILLVRGSAANLGFSPSTIRSIEILMSAAQVGVAGMLALGYWWYTQPDPGYVGQESTTGARRVLRSMAVVRMGFEVVTLVTTFIAPLGGSVGSVAEYIAYAALLLGFVAWCVQFFATMRYTRWLARRVPDAYIVRRASRYMWLLPLIATVGAIAVYIGPLLALVMYWNLLDRLRKHFKAIRSTGVPAVLKGMVAR